jgi:AcrR family transcriptional regulator
MRLRTTDEAAATRRSTILQAARWCFLNFGFSKTSLEDIAKRANLSRTLLYKQFKDKEEIYTAVFTDWLLSRKPAAQKAAAGKGNRYERLLAVARLMVVEPWSDMTGAPMAQEFFEVCERLDPAISAEHRTTTLQCVASVLSDEAAAEVFVLAIEGLITDEPSVETLDQRVQLLADRFVRASSKKG